MPHHHTLKKNAIFLSRHNTTKHELAKCVGAIMLKKFGEVKFSKQLIIANESMANIIDLTMKEFKGHSDFITEACANEEDRIVDLVNLRTNDRIEFECDHKIKKSNCITVYI